MTRRQLQCLNFIKRFELRNNRAPTYREISHAMGFRGFSARLVTSWIKALEERKQITVWRRGGKVSGLTAWQKIPGHKFMAWPNDRG